MSSDKGDILAKAVDAHRRGSLQEAEQLYLRHLQSAPRDANARMLLGSLAMASGRAHAAASLMAEALSLNPNLPDGYYNLGLALLADGRPEQARAALSRAMTHGGKDADLFLSLGNALLYQGRPAESLRLYDKALRLAPGNPVIAGAAVMARQYLPGITTETLLALHERTMTRWNATPTATHAPPASDSTVRVGLVSPDLRRHPVGYFMLPWLEGRQTDRLQVACYSDAVPDEMTAQLRANANNWHDTRGMDDAAVAELIRQDGVQVLVDLAGLTRGHRFPLFAGRAAPVQATWAGYVGTTGIQAMDYLITDHVQTPPGSAPGYRERLVRMPECYVCYRPPEYLPPVSDLPAASRAGLTFGCLNDMAKLNAEVLAFWAELLNRLPDSTLLIANRQLGDHGVRDAVLNTLRRSGLNSQRVELLSGRPHKDFLALYREMDVALDPFPYSGGLTTLEALAMGVPVLGVTGATFAGRHAASHMTAVGLPEWIAPSPAACLERAGHLTRDLEALSALRSGLRERLFSSPLCNGPRFARHLEAAVRTMWRQRQESAQRGFDVPVLPVG